MAQKSLKKNALLNIFKTLLGVIFPLITFPYSSRILQPDGIGKVNFAQSVVSYFAIFAALGISSYGIREAAKLRDDKKQLSKFCKEIFILNCISMIVAYITLIIAIFFIPKFIPYRSVLCVCSATIIFTTIGMDWLYKAEEDYSYITIRHLFFQVLSVFFLFIFIKTKDDYIKYAGIAVFANVGSNILNFFHSKKYISFRHCKIENPFRHLKSVLVLFSMAVAISIYTTLDTTMVGLLSNDFQVGLYTASTKINKIVLQLVTSIGFILMPRLSYYIGKNDFQSFNRLVYKSIDVMFLISIPCTIGLSILSESVILLLSGSYYVQAIPVMRMMNPIIVIIGMGSLLGSQILIPMGKEKYTLVSEIIGAVSNFSLNLILIPRFQAFGAAIATVSAESLVTATQIFFARKYFTIYKFFFSFLKYFLNSIVMGIIVFFIISFFEAQYLKLILGICTGIVVYIFLLFIEKNPIIFEVFMALKSKISNKKNIIIKN
jgi:O-antigen/teichoic acid export membrane protein